MPVGLYDAVAFNGVDEVGVLTHVLREVRRGRDTERLLGDIEAEQSSWVPIEPVDDEVRCLLGPTT